MSVLKLEAMGLSENGHGESDSDSEEEEDFWAEDIVLWWETWRWFIDLVVVVVYFLVGVIYVRTAERWDTITCIYFVIQIVTTIGYGDVTVTEAGSQWFMIVYVFVGVAICANIINSFLDRHLNATNEMFKQRLRKLEAAMSTQIASPEEARHRLGPLNGMLVALFVYFAFLIAGTLFFANYESCTCSYGPTRVDNCIEGEDCVSTHGVTKNFRTSLYMSVITLSTTGFGDFTPKTRGGRVFGVFWMPLGVLSWVNLVAAVLDWWRHVKMAYKRKQLALDMAELTKLDPDHDGRVTQAEFRIFFLMKEGLVSKADVKHMDRFFAALDKESRGWLSMEDLRGAVSLERKLEFKYL